jgi:hypothetical protein
MFHLLLDSNRRSRGALRARLALGLIFSVVAANSAWAKDVPITGVLVYGSGGSLAYVQVTGLLVNGKTELRACSGAGIDKSVYKDLAKINLASVKTLERLPDGTMMAEIGEAPPVCVVPGNFKYEKEGALSPADLADRGVYTGQVVGSSAPAQTALPPFAAGSKIFFGSASDKEFAEYSLATRANSIAAWQGYLKQFPAGAHLTDANASLVALQVKDGAQKLASFKASSASATPAYSDLQVARERADQALEVQAGNADAAKLRDGVRAELKLLSDDATAKLTAFHDATVAHAPGYPLLVSATDLSGHISAVDPKYAPGVTLAASVAAENKALDTTVQAANAQVAAKQYDAAYTAIAKYLSFAGEEPRLKQIVAADYKFHLDNGNAEVTANNWADAVVDFKRAAEITPSAESKTALANAQAGLLAQQNRDAADKALALSKQHIGENDPIAAYEVLADLNDAQRLLVKDDLTGMQDAYVQAATAKANELELAHMPIQGRADEDALRQAYDYLLRASKLSSDPQIGLKLELMAETISNYYVGVAGKYLNKPLSSGVGLGWSYLNEAAQYRPNLDVIRDAMTTNTAAYQMRSRLSIGVVFRDQTSRRDSAGFADQLQQAFATGLETSGLPVKVVLPGSSGTLEPNFQFVGEILQHRTTRNSNIETLQSEYRSGSREIPNDAWNKADQAYEAANLDLQKAQTALTAAQSKNNKKQEEDAQKQIDAAQTAVASTRAKMNAIPKTLSDDVVSPYNYSKTTLELTNIVELSFRIMDSSGNIVGDPIHVIKGDQPKKFVILDNIKPEDTKGVKAIDAPPDEVQMMTDVEIEARDTMVKAARDKVQGLPQRILAQARDKATSNDLEGAGELYVLYLNCTPATSTPERTEAAKFLYDNFNIRNTVNLRASAQ